MSKRQRTSSSSEEKTVSEAERQCGAVWFDNVPTHVSVTELVKQLVAKSGSQLTSENIIPSPRSDRGGILLKFEPKKYSELAYELAARLEWPDVHAHPPNSVLNESKMECVCFGIPTHHTEIDLLFFFNPRPVSVVRFSRKNGNTSSPTNTVKLTFASQDIVNSVVEKGILLGRARKRCKPYVKSPTVFCRRCKKPGPQHMDCEIMCGWCQGKHATSLCEAKQRQEAPKCLRCSGEHAYFNCPEVRKLRSDAVKRKQNQISGHNPKLPHAGGAAAPPGVSLLEVAQQLVPIVIDAVLKMLQSGGFIAPEDVKKVQESTSKDVLSVVKDQFSDAKQQQQSSYVKVASRYSQAGVDALDTMQGVEFTTVKAPSSSSSSKDEKIACKHCNKLYFKKGLGPHEKSCPNNAQRQ